jgi:SnoaL-like domain
MNAYEEITNVVNKLFVFTDEQDWSALKSEVFDRDVDFDMVSMGAEKAQKITAVEICEMWQEGFKGLDAIHHQAGNYIISIENKQALVKAYAIASHYKNATTEGKTREFVGSYDIGLLETNRGWRINSFKYNLKYADGNIEFK